MRVIHNMAFTNDRSSCRGRPWLNRRKRVAEGMRFAFGGIMVLLGEQLFIPQRSVSPPSVTHAIFGSF